jgi:hypothetical protein
MDWKIPPLREKADLLKDIHAIEPNLRFDSAQDSVETLPIPFYPDGALIRCRKGAGDYLWYVKLKGQEMVSLDGSVANIHHLNFYAPLKLTENLLPAYLKFRLYFGLENGRRRHVMGQKSKDVFLFQEEGKIYAGRFKISPRGETELLEKTPQTDVHPLQSLPEFCF